MPMARTRTSTRNLDPPPAEVPTRTPAVWTEADMARTAEYWGLRKDHVKGLLLVRWLIEAGRLGKDDRN